MISSYLQLLERRYADDLDDDAEVFVEFAVDAAERIREMIDGLLAYSRVETGRSAGTDRSGGSPRGRTKYPPAPDRGDRIANLEAQNIVD